MTFLGSFGAEQQIKHGTLGFCKSLEIAGDGSWMIVRGDVGCGAVRKPATPTTAWQGHWKQLWDYIPTSLTSLSWLSTDPGFQYTGAGVPAIAIAKVNTKIGYFIYRGYLVKIDVTNFDPENGVAPTVAVVSALPQFAASTNQTAYSNWDAKIILDPRNDNHIIVAPETGSPQRSTDGGATWAAIASIPAPTATFASADARVILAFDASSAATGGRTSRIIAASQGNGVYESTNAGVSFAQISSTLKWPMDIEIDSTGRVYYTDGGSAKEAGPLWAGYYESAAWHQMTDPQWTGTAQPLFFTVNPANSNEIIASDYYGHLWRTTNRGASAWYQYYGNNSTFRVNMLAHLNPDAPTANDQRPGLLATLKGTFAQDSLTLSGDYPAMEKPKFHPTLARLYIPTGFGVVYIPTPLPAATQGAGGTLNWYEDTAGFEELATTHGVVFPNGNALLGFHDRGYAISTKDLSAPVSIFPVPWATGAVLADGMSGDYAIDDPTWVVAFGALNKMDSRYGDLSGEGTWTLFPTGLANVTGGALAVRNKGEVFALPGQDQPPVWHPDVRAGGAWQSLSFVDQGGSPVTVTDGWYNYYYRKIRNLVTDKLTGHTYAWNVGTNAGLYKLPSGAVDGVFHRIQTGVVVAGYYGNHHTMAAWNNIIILAGDGAAGDVSGYPARISTNGGTTFSNLAGINSPHQVALGAPHRGGTTPVIYAGGWVGGVLGVHYSEDLGASWQNTGAAYKADPTGGGMGLAVDPKTFGRLFNGLDAMGWAAREFALRRSCI